MEVYAVSWEDQLGRPFSIDEQGRLEVLVVPNQDNRELQGL